MLCVCQFSEQLADPEAVFTYQKRLSHCKQQESQSDHNSVAQRPRLKTTVNAKIPTAIRQKFLDGFVDEHLKMAASVQCAYQQVCCHTPFPMHVAHRVRVVYGRDAEFTHLRLALSEAILSGCVV